MQKNIRDYLIYFLTLMLSVSMFYAFSSIESQPALKDLGATKQLLADQLAVFISALSVVVAVVLAFLILYANQFLLKRRKKELGIYTLLGMKKRKISLIFVGETFCVGVISLICGIVLGLALSQGLSLLSLRLFAVEMSQFQMVFSMSALKKTVGCFSLIFLLVLLFNARSVSGTKLIDLLMANRKNDAFTIKNKTVQMVLIVLSVLCIMVSGVMIDQNGIMPSRENSWLQIAVILLAIGTVLFFFSVSAVFLTVAHANSRYYLSGLNAFLSRQIGSKIRTDFLTLAIVCGLLTVAISGVTVGISTAITMNQTSEAALPFDLNVVSDIDLAGDADISEYLQNRNVDLRNYAEDMAQISLYEADITYGELFSGQDASLWHVDAAVPELNVYAVSISDFNRSLEIQGKTPVELGDGEFLLNCNYEGTLQYINGFLQTTQTITLNGVTLQSKSENALEETYWMTSVGNNDRGTFVIPDETAMQLNKDANILLVQYKPETDPDEVLQKMVPIGLEWETEGYRYAAQNMMQEMYYGSCALIVFLCCYIGLIFLLVCAVLLSLKQLTETADNVYRYGLLQKLGADTKMVYGTLLKQIAVFFVAPLLVASIYSAFGISKIMVLVEDFINIRIATNMGFTVIMFLLVYGGYFLATYLSCKRMVQERQIERMEV